MQYILGIGYSRWDLAPKSTIREQARSLLVAGNRF